MGNRKSLHTLLVRQLVRMFHRPELNPRGAQLIFTAHDTSLLDAHGLFRRDQIWFVDKAVNQASTLFPLTDFSPRKGEALEKGYLQGRYGGIPVLDMESPGTPRQTWPTVQRASPMEQADVLMEPSPESYPAEDDIHGTR